MRDLYPFDLSQKTEREADKFDLRCEPKCLAEYGASKRHLPLVEESGMSSARVPHTRAVLVVRKPVAEGNDAGDREAISEPTTYFGDVTVTRKRWQRRKKKKYREEMLHHDTC